MPNKPVSMMTYVKRIVDDVYAGRLMDAAHTMMAPSKKQAVVVTAYVLDQVHDHPNYGALLRVLESFFDD